MQFDDHLCDIKHGFNGHGASRGLWESVISELLVIFTRTTLCMLARVL